MRKDAPSPGDRRATLLLRLGADGKVDLEVTAGLRRALPGPLLEEAMRAALGRMSCTASELQAQGRCLANACMPCARTTLAWIRGWQAEPCVRGNPRTGTLHGFESSNIKQRSAEVCRGGPGGGKSSSPGAACSTMAMHGAKRFLFSAPPPQGARYTRASSLPCVPSRWGQTVFRFRN